MAFKTDTGDGSLGEIAVAEGSYNRINSYARVIAIDKNIITIDAENAYAGDFETFKAGDEIMLHCSATNGTETSKLGAYLFARIEVANRNVLELDSAVFDVDLNYYYVQAVTVANFKSVYLLENAVLTPPPFDPFKFIGGIIAIKAWQDFSFEGGHIDLTDCGIPTKYKDRLRPITYQESAVRGELDSGQLAGAENFITDKILMNAGDGIAFIAAKNLKCSGNSRIGNIKTYGKAHCRGAQDTKFKPSNVTNIGGSTIVIAADTIDDFDAKLLAKYRDSRLDAGKGLARCFIATEENLPHDDLLYSSDLIHDDYRVIESYGVESFDYDELDLRGINVIYSFVCAKHLIVDTKTKFPPDSTIIADTITGFTEDCLQGVDNFVFANQF